MALFKKATKSPPTSSPAKPPAPPRGGAKPSAAAPAPGRGVLVEKPRANVYTVMLVVSFIALVIGCVCLANEMALYDWDFKAAPNGSKVPPRYRPISAPASGYACRCCATGSHAQPARSNSRQPTASAGTVWRTDARGRTPPRRRDSARRRQRSGQSPPPPGSTDTRRKLLGLRGRRLPCMGAQCEAGQKTEFLHDA